MPQKIVTCAKCEGSFDVGHIPAGRKVKCPQCGNFFAVPGDAPAAAPAPASRGGVRPTRATPLMRKVQGARPAGGAGVMPSRRSMDTARPGARRSKGNTGLVVGLCVGGAVLLIGLVVLMGGKKKSPPQKKKVQEEQQVVEAPAPPPPPAPASGPGPSSAAPSVYIPPDTFQKGSYDDAVDDWKVDAILAEEVDRDLRASHEKGGDLEIRKGLVNQVGKYYNTITDRLRSDDEVLAKEAAAVSNLILRKYELSFGKMGADFIPDPKIMNDPQRRRAHFGEMRKAWEAVESRMKESSGAAAAAGGGGGAQAPANFMEMIDNLRHGGEERDQALGHMRKNKSYFVRQLIPVLSTDDPSAGRACASALNELTGASLPVPSPAEWKGPDLKKTWDDWLLTNADKLQ